MTPAARMVVLRPRFSQYALALDFKNGLYKSSRGLVRDPSLLPGYTYTRSGAKSEVASGGTIYPFAANVPGIVPGDGYWSRGSLTNLLLNAGSSSDLSTQSVTVTAQAYTLSFIGTGTITLSGVSTAGPLVGTGANNRVSLTFTPTAGSLTVTVSGSCKYAGLVAGTQPGPIIVTAGATATVGADSFTATSPITSDEDFAFWATPKNLIWDGAEQVLLTLGNSATSRIIISRNISGSYGCNMNNGAHNTISVATASDGRAAVLFRRRGGKNTLAAKNPSGSVSVSAETGAIAFPSGMAASLLVGAYLTGLPSNSPIEFVGIRRGTFSDADITAILQAA